MLLEYLNLFYIGLIEGITEFLPVSSTGHIILLEDLLGYKPSEGKCLEITIQLASLLAVCVYLRQEIKDILLNIFHRREINFILAIIIGIIPPAILGYAFHDVIVESLFTPKVVAFNLLVGGIIIWVIESLNIKPKIFDFRDMPLRKALFIGICQCLALVPGTSRSGATIMAAIAVKVEKQAATKFSFIMAIPTMLMATVYSLSKNSDYMTSELYSKILFTGLVAFTASILSIKFLFALLQKYGFKPFAIYRIIVGTIFLVAIYY